MSVLKVVLSLYFVLLLSLLFGQSENKPVIIRGNIIDYHSEQLYFTKSYKYEDFMKEGDRILLSPDSMGVFEININLLEPQYFILGYNHIYLTPGDTLNVALNTIYPEKTAYRGKNAMIQEYLLHASFDRSGSFLDGGLNIKSSREETLNHILALAKGRYKDLEKLKGASKVFEMMEKARIRADLINTLDYFLPYYNMKLKRKGEEANEDLDCEFLEKEITPRIKQLAVDFVDSRYLDLRSYRTVSSYILNNNAKISIEAEKLIESREVTTILNSIMRGEYENSKEEIDLRIAKLNDSENRNELNSYVEQRSDIGKTVQAIDLQFEDVNGKIINLSDYQGKVIYIDFWATWCSPCIEERKNFKKLSDRFAKDDVVFLAISIDRDKKKWVDYKSLYSDGVEEVWLEDREIQKYNVAYIPRYVLIDKGFNIVESYAPKPSSDGIVEKISMAIQ